MTHVIKLLLAGVVILAVTGAALSITPVYHNFGKVPVGVFKEMEFKVTLSPRPTPGTTLRYVIRGADAVDFDLRSGTDIDSLNPAAGATVDPLDPLRGCAAGAQGVVCTVGVQFRPESMGPKKAALDVEHGRGSTSATLEGEGVAALCTHTVVPCNYAHHYSGVVQWSDGTAGVNVDVVKGVASCNALGESEMVSGPGIIGVEFGESADAPSPFYRITVACPTRYPPEPARPAELGHGEFGSYKQKLNRTIVEVQTKGPPRLWAWEGEVSWNLCPHAQYVPRSPTTVGPHEHCPVPP